MQWPSGANPETRSGKMSYDKPWKGYEEQLELLMNRGMEVDDRGRPGLVKACGLLSPKWLLVPAPYP